MVSLTRILNYKNAVIIGVILTRWSSAWQLRLELTKWVVRVMMIYNLWVSFRLIQNMFIVIWQWLIRAGVILQKTVHSEVKFLRAVSENCVVVSIAIWRRISRFVRWPVILHMTREMHGVLSKDIHMRLWLNMVRHSFFWLVCLMIKDCGELVQIEKRWRKQMQSYVSMLCRCLTSRIPVIKKRWLKFRSMRIFGVKTKIWRTRNIASCWNRVRNGS